MDAACERMSEVTQSFKPACSFSILPVERVSKAAKSFAETSEAVTNLSAQASKSRSKAVSGVVNQSCFDSMTVGIAAVHISCSI